MRTFNSLEEYFNKLSNVVLTSEPILDEQCNETLNNVQKRHGRYPSDIHWEKLKPQTIKYKKTGDSPLLETGDLRDSYRKQVGNNTGQVSSNNEKAVWMEYGVPSNNIPARPVILPEKKIAEKQLVDRVQKALELKLNSL